MNGRRNQPRVCAFDLHLKRGNKSLIQLNVSARLFHPEFRLSDAESAANDDALVTSFAYGEGGTAVISMN